MERLRSRSTIELEKRKQNKPINNMSTEVEVTHPENLHQGLTKLGQFTSVEDMIKYAKVLMDGKLIPASFKTPEAVVSAIQMSKELKVNPITGLNNIIVIQGKPTLTARLQAALVRNYGVVWKTVKDGLPLYSNGTNIPNPPKDGPDGKLIPDRPIDYETVIRFYVPFHNTVIEDDVRFTYTMAHSMGLTTKDNWVKMRTQMLYARCLSTGIMRNCPQAINGLYETSEIIDSMGSDEFTYDIDQEGNMTVKNKK
jgi:hypothetical protein